MTDTKQPVSLRPRPPNMTDEQWRAWVEGELQDGANMFNQLSAEIQTNTEVTNQVKADTSALVEFSKSIEGAIKVLKWVGNVAKYVGYIATATLALWAIITAFVNGTPPSAK